MTLRFFVPGSGGRSVHERFIAKVEGPIDDCWLWTGYILPNGYGQLWVDGRNENAHRVSYEMFVGQIPEGLQIDHLCRQKRCVNPTHLEAVTPRENTFRAEHGPAGINARKTHCPEGHTYDDANTYVTPAGRRRCRACARRKALARYYRLRDAA